MPKNITTKIRELLTPEDLAIFENAVESMIEEKTQANLSNLIQLKEEELKLKYEKLAESYVKKAVSKKLTVAKAKLVESYDKKLSLLEQKIVTKLDSYLDHVISEQISDEMLEKVAINETLQPVVEGIRSVFSNNHIKLESGAQNKIEKLEDEFKEIKTELSESIDKRIELETKLEQSAVYLLISEKTNGLKRSDKQKVVEMFKNKEFEEVENNIDNYLSIIKESHSPKTTTKTKRKVKKTVVNEGAVVDQPKKAPKQVEKLTEEVSLVDISNKYLND